MSSDPPNNWKLLEGEERRQAQAFADSVEMQARFRALVLYDLRSVDLNEYKRLIEHLWSLRKFLKDFHAHLLFTFGLSLEQREDVIHECRFRFLTQAPEYLSKTYIYIHYKSHGYRLADKAMSRCHDSLEYLASIGQEPGTEIELLKVHWMICRPHFYRRMRKLVYRYRDQERSRQGTWDAYALVDIPVLLPNEIRIVLNRKLAAVHEALSRPLLLDDRVAFECHSLAIEPQSVERASDLTLRSIDTVNSDLAAVRSWERAELIAFTREALDVQ